MASVAAFLGLSFLAWSSPLAGEDLLVSRWSLAEGLPQSSPNALAVGPGGYLWVGTEQGLARFDGIRFRVWDTRDGLPGERVVALEATEAGVWVATTPGGLSRLRGGRIEPVLRDVTVFDLAAGADGVWLAAREGLFWVGEDGGVQRMDLPGGAGEASVLLPAADGTLWVGHAEGISRHTPDGGWRDLPTADLEAPITGLAGDERSLWAAARDGFWHREDGTWRRILYAREVKPQVATDPAGDTWLWSRDGGLRRFYRGEVERVPALDELEGWHVFDVVPEGDTTVWVGLGGEGLVRLRRPLFQTVTTADGLAVPAVHGVIEGRDGSLWLGSLEAGVTRLRGGEMRRFGTAEGLPAPAVWALGLDSTGRVWVGTPRGLAYEDGERFRIAEAVAATPIHGLAPGDDGSMYYSAGGGAFHVAGDVVREVVPPQTLRRGGGLLFRTRDRDLWLGGEGACRWRRGELRCFSEAEGLPPDLVRSAWQSPVGEIWLGTYGGGLCRFREPAHFDCLSEDRGLPHRTVHAIVPDRLGWLWLPSNRGLGRARLEDVERALQDPAATIRADVFGLEDGLPDLELNGGVPPGGVALEDGRLAMATMGGLALVDPDRVVARVSAAPIVHLEAVEVDGRPLDPAATLDVGAGSDRVTFHYTGIYPRAPESLRFRYRLAPHDDDWVPAGGQRSTTYTGLSPGRYHFAVAASVGGSPWSAAAETELVLRPFFWQTRWFFALVVVAIGGGASALYRLRVRRLVELERLRLRIASDLHDELGSELSGISLASAMLESEDDLRDPARRRLGEIRASSSRLLERLRDIVWLIDPGGDGVGPLAERMEMVAESLTPGIRLEFAADAVAAELPLSMTQRRDLLLLLRELVTNAVRHAGASAIRVRFEARNDRLELEVRDDGCGFEPTAASSGSGLRSVRDRAAALGGELTIESGAGAGTRALLSVPMMTRSRGSAGRRWKAR